MLDIDSGKVTDERLLIDHGYERPSLNLGFVGSPSRYCCLLDEHGDGYMGKGVLKYDLIDEREVAYLDYGDMYGGEALFVPKAEPRGEDDGCLLDLLMADDRADLIVVDATTMTEVARLHLPQRVPFGVHACWLDQDDLGSLGVVRPHPDRANHSRSPTLPVGAGGDAGMRIVGAERYAEGRSVSGSARLVAPAAAVGAGAAVRCWAIRSRARAAMKNMP
ncbi:MAG: carotenoid cleavage dioxygenase [Streptomyces oryziradicis]|nr:carotenoid cleavage dioxygenase [Actinacidiphila oryziradicis]